MEKRKRDKHKVMRSFAMISQFGINMLVPVFICVFIGMWLDSHLGTGGLCVCILFFLGAAAGFRNIYIMSRDIYGDEDGSGKKH